MKIEIPEELGEISQVFENPGSDKTIIIMPQKAMDRYSYEKGIFRTLEYLAKTYGLKLAMPEGASGKLDVSWFKAFPDNEIKAKVSDDFMKKGEITGLEHLMITTEYPIEAWGIEDTALWKKSADLLKTAQPTIGYFLMITDKIKGHILSLREKASDPSLELDQAIQSYNEGMLKINDYFFYLEKKAISVGINLKIEYPDYFRVLESFKNPWGHVYQMQARALIEALSGMTGQSESKKDDTEEEILSPKKALSRLAYSEDETKIIKELRLKLCDNENQSILANLYGNIKLLVNLTHMQGTPYQFSEFKHKRHEFSSEYFQNALSKYEVRLTEEDIETLDTFVPIMERFYELAKQRQIHDVNKAIEYMENTGNNLGVMLIMGFNTRGIMDVLEQKAIAYYVIMVNEVKFNE